jgi:hypothetical protein
MNASVEVNLVSDPETPLCRSFVSVCEAVNRNVRNGVGPGHRELSREHGIQKERRNGLRKAPPRRSGSTKNNLPHQNLDEPRSNAEMLARLELMRSWLPMIEDAIEVGQRK